MKLQEEKETVKAKPSTVITLASLLFLASSLLEIWGFYITGFKVFTLLLLATAGLLAALGLLRLKSWSLWLSYALYPPQIVQASTLFWSLTLLVGFPTGSYGGLLQIGLCIYLILLTLFILLLWKNKDAFQ